MAYFKQLTGWDTSPFQPKYWLTDLDQVILATDYFDRTGAKKNVEFPPLGATRYENACLGQGVYKNISVHGEAKFMWVWNNSGSNIAKGVPLSKRADQSISNLDADVGGVAQSGVNYASKTATFTANKEIGGIVTVLDDAANGGAAPEGEFAFIWKNDANKIYFQPDLTAALAANDDLIIKYDAHVLAGGSGLQLCDFRGVPVASGGIPDGYMGWACIEADLCAILGAASTGTHTINKGLIAGTATFVEGSSSAVPLILAIARQGLKSDTVSRLILASLGARKVRGASA